VNITKQAAALTGIVSQGDACPPMAAHVETPNVASAAA
jgi:hypothetical protein